MSGPALLADGARCAPSSGQDPSLRCKGYGVVMARWRAGHARPLQGGVNELRAKAHPTEYGKVGCRAACPQAAADVCGKEKPCGLCCRGTASPTPRGGVKTPPYDAKGKRGGNGEAAGRACPAPTDCRKRGRGREGRRRAAARPLSACEGCPGMGGHAQPVGIPQSANAASPL